MTTTNFFQPTKEELAKADKTRPVFKADEVVGFLVTEIKEGVDNDGKARVIVGTNVTTGEHTGKDFAFFINDNPTSKGIIINMMKCFWSDEEMLAGQAGGIKLIGKQFSSPCKESHKLVNGETKTYQNFYQFTAVDSTPSIPTTETDSNIPF